MKYIDKNNEKSRASAKALHEWRDNFKDENDKRFEEICTDLDSEKAWRLIYDYGKGLKIQIRTALFEEQIGICCYCCQELELDDKEVEKTIHIEETEETKTVIEHFLPKSDDVCENTYNNNNLLLSCDGNHGISQAPRKFQPNKGKDTWENIAYQIIQRHSKRNPDFSITVDDLKRMNPQQAQNPIAKGQIIYELSHQHCDNFKGNDKTIIINPASLPDCWERFQYDNKGFVHGSDSLAQTTITVLNLNAKILETMRAHIWTQFEKEYNSNLEVLNCFEKEDWAALKEYTKNELDKEIEGNITYPFCIVNRAFFKKAYEKAEILFIRNV